MNNILTHCASLRNARSVAACMDPDVSLLAILRLLTAAISVPSWDVRECAIGSPKETQSLLSTQGLCIHLPFVCWGNRPSSLETSCIPKSRVLRWSCACKLQCVPVSGDPMLVDWPHHFCCSRSGSPSLRSPDLLHMCACQS